MIDLRSDTVTRPTAAMLAAMHSAEVGDDVFDDDPTVRQLQAHVADDMGFEAALFFPSGTQCNLAALLAQCQRGDEYLVGQDAHCYKYEGGGAAVLGSIQPQPLPLDANGAVDLDAAARAIKADDDHFARTRLLALENTHHGRVQPLSHHRAAHDFCQRHGLRLHLDGARLFNAATALNCHARELAHGFDSVSLCLSKGLGAPAGSVLCADADTIRAARRWRKMLGGGMRQVGVLAAAAHVAYCEGPQHLAEDHRRARLLAEALRSLPGINLREDWLHSNMVWADFSQPIAPAGLKQQAEAAGILLSPGPRHMRLVTHRDLDDAAIDQAAAFFRRYFTAQQ